MDPEIQKQFQLQLDQIRQGLGPINPNIKHTDTINLDFLMPNYDPFQEAPRKIQQNHVKQEEMDNQETIVSTYDFVTRPYHPSDPINLPHNNNNQLHQHLQKLKQKEYNQFNAKRKNPQSQNQQQIQNNSFQGYKQQKLNQQSKYEINLKQEQIQDDQQQNQDQQVEQQQQTPFKIVKNRDNLQNKQQNKGIRKSVKTQAIEEENNYENDDDNYDNQEQQNNQQQQQNFKIAQNRPQQNLVRKLITKSAPRQQEVINIENSESD